MSNPRNIRFATEIPRQDPPGVLCQRQFAEHGIEILLLENGEYEDGVPMGKLFVNAAGIHIELYEEERQLPVTVTRKIVKIA
jgi:hypothetical protein